jgi:hypothetical protein
MQVFRPRLTVLQIPLPEIPPLVIALIPTDGKDMAESIHEQHIVLLKMAARLELKVLVTAADGTRYTACAICACSEVGEDDMIPLRHQSLAMMWLSHFLFVCMCPYPGHGT